MTAALYAPSLRNGFAYDDAYVAAATYPSGRPNRMISELQPLAGASPYGELRVRVGDESCTFTVRNEPGVLGRCGWCVTWIPAFAGMTK